jgi:hypothetical protein
LPTKVTVTADIAESYKPTTPGRNTTKLAGPKMSWAPRTELAVIIGAGNNGSARDAARNETIKE